ncbi:hypothetical protein YPPY03_1190, partial [Yersinia pestis PY-03]
MSISAVTSILVDPAFSVNLPTSNSDRLSRRTVFGA